jgi:hypothetical protein
MKRKLMSKKVRKMARKKSKTSTIEELIASSAKSEWCVVDTDNKFTYDDSNNYIIGSNVKPYMVLNKPVQKDNGKWNDWTNDSLMTQILVVDTGEEIRFFDENLVEVASESIKYV